MTTFRNSALSPSLRPFGVRYQVVCRDGRIETRRRFFGNQRALDRWVSKQERDNPAWVAVLAWLA